MVNELIDRMRVTPQNTHEVCDWINGRPNAWKETYDGNAFPDMGGLCFPTGTDADAGKVLYARWGDLIVENRDGTFSLYRHDEEEREPEAKTRTASLNVTPVEDLIPPPADEPDHGLPFGNITVKYHEGSDRYTLVSQEKDAFGVPYLEVQINRATIDGKDQREQVAVAMWEALIVESDRFKEIGEGNGADTTGEPLEAGQEGT